MLPSGAPDEIRGLLGPQGAAWRPRPFDGDAACNAQRGGSHRLRDARRRVDTAAKAQIGTSPDAKPLSRTCPRPTRRSARLLPLLSEAPWSRQEQLPPHGFNHSVPTNAVPVRDHQVLGQGGVMVQTRKSRLRSDRAASTWAETLCYLTPRWAGLCRSSLCERRCSVRKGATHRRLWLIGVRPVGTGPGRFSGTSSVRPSRQQQGPSVGIAIAIAIAGGCTWALEIVSGSVAMVVPGAP